MAEKTKSAPSSAASSSVVTVTRGASESRVEVYPSALALAAPSTEEMEARTWAMTSRRPASVS